MSDKKVHEPLLQAKHVSHPKPQHCCHCYTNDPESDPLLPPQYTFFDQIQETTPLPVLYQKIRKPELALVSKPNKKNSNFAETESGN